MTSPSNYWTNLLQDYGKQSLESRRYWYSAVAASYDRVRPRYGHQLLNEALGLAAIANHSRLLEIGCGPGTATVDLARKGLQITALEPGQAAYALAQEHCAPFPLVSVVNTTFEEWTPPAEPFDAVLAATAWHWIDPAIAYTKAAQCLKPQGALLLLWNTPPQPDRETYENLGPIYSDIAPEIPVYARYHEIKIHLEQFEHLTADIDGSSYFHTVAYRYVPLTVVYPIEDYLELLSTLSPYIALGQERRHLLFQALATTLHQSVGETIPLHYCSAFHVARKIGDPA